MYNAEHVCHCSWLIVVWRPSLLFFIKDYELSDKRKTVVVITKEKLIAIKRLDSGITAKTVASELRVGKSS